MVDYMHYKKDLNNDCPYCKYETGDYCSRCGKPLSENAMALEHKLKKEFEEGMLNDSRTN